MPRVALEEVPIFDSLHGFVRITPAEKEIINSLYFQRLRDIKQLSFAYYVFPGAVHTRFSHSIGVLATITKILDRLDDIRSEISEEEYLLLRMAALLHDIGHYPLSHLIEQTYKEHQKRFLLELASEDEEGGNAEFLREYEQQYPSVIADAKIHDAHHEQLGAYIVRNTDFEGGITYILRKHNFTQDQIDDIALTIQGKSLTTWHNQIVHSELDVDRLDYLTRDSRETGVQYGNFDFDYLVNNCRLFTDETGKKIFAVKSSAVFTVEHFLLARYFWYAQIISERTISIFDHLGQSVFSWLISNGFAHKYIDILELVKHPNEFVKFNDNYFWERIYFGTTSEQVIKRQGSEFFTEACQYIIKRIPLKRLRLPIKKSLKYKNFGCDHIDCQAQVRCRKSSGCPRFDTDRDIRRELQDITSQIKREISDHGKNPDWIIDLYKISTISKLSTLRTSEEKERDPIRIIDGNSVVFLEQLEHSMVRTLNEYELVQPRIYAKEEYLGLLDPHYSTGWNDV